MEHIKNFFAMLMGNKLKIVLFFVATIGFIVFMFPFGDLSDKISAEVAAGSDNTVYLQFDDMAFTMLPQPAIKMTNVIAETPFASDISISELSIAPSILGAMMGKPHGRAYAEGLFSGALDASVGSSSRIKIPEAVSANVEFTNFDLKELVKAIPSLPLSPSGRGNLNIVLDVDPSMKSQPDGDIDLQVAAVQIPSFAIPLGMMPPLPLPGFNLEKLTLKGKLKNGKFILSDTQIGTTKDELSARITGDLDMRVFPGGSVNVGFYNLAIDLNIKDSAQTKFGSMMSIIDGFLGKYSSKGVSSKRYAFRIQANGFQDPAPQFSPL